jgi:hypothetical protein
MMDQQNQTDAPVRQNRLARAMDSREKNMRPQSWRNPEALPNPDDRPGWKHRWVRLSIMGSSDPKNISSKLREGYEPCKAEEYPELMLPAITEGRFKGGIEIGGLLLCRIPEEFLVQRMQHFDAQNRAQMESVDNAYLSENDRRMQKFSERSTKVTFGPRS